MEIRAACSNSALTAFFGTQQVEATWVTVSGIKWPKQPTSTGTRSTVNPVCWRSYTKEPYLYFSLTYHIVLVSFSINISVAAQIYLFFHWTSYLYYSHIAKMLDQPNSITRNIIMRTTILDRCLLWNRTMIFLCHINLWTNCNQIRS